MPFRNGFGNYSISFLENHWIIIIQSLLFHLSGEFLFSHTLCSFSKSYIIFLSDNTMHGVRNLILPWVNTQARGYFLLVLFQFFFGSILGFSFICKCTISLHFFIAFQVDSFKESTSQTFLSFESRKVNDGWCKLCGGVVNWVLCYHEGAGMGLSLWNYQKLFLNWCNGAYWWVDALLHAAIFVAAVKSFTHFSLNGKNPLA